MGRVKAMLMDLESEAAEMTKEEFLKIHPNEEGVWDSVHNPQDEPDFSEALTHEEQKIVDNINGKIHQPTDKEDDNKLMENVKCRGQ